MGAIADAAMELMLFALPIWVAAMVGLLIGWAWKPRWTGLLFLGLRSRARLICTIPPGLGARRLWIAFTALSAFSVCRSLWGNFRWKRAEDEQDLARDPVAEPCSPGDITSVGDRDIISNSDLEHLLHLLDGKDGGSFWQNMMERTTSNMTYRAWRHEPEMGPIMYCSRTVFEDAAPEIVRDFFWDDEFRTKWDNMFAFGKILEEFPHTGEMIVHWIKKFPFFCSDREYIIGRRIWESGRTYYCVTKGIPYPALPKKERPRRVDLYFSSWRIRAVESRRQDGQLTACEVALVHYEDMGIPKDVAKVGIRHGMWGTVKRLQSGMRAYQQARKSNMPLSRTALMAQNMTKISASGLTCSCDSESSDAEDDDGATKIIGTSRKEQGIDWRLLLIGGTVAVACGFRSGIISKALLLGAARRLGRG